MIKSVTGNRKHRLCLESGKMAFRHKNETDTRLGTEWDKVLHIFVRRENENPSVTDLHYRENSASRGSMRYYKNKAELITLSHPV